jgi:prepilin-type processing-associated H-X9-DG protein
LTDADKTWVLGNMKSVVEFTNETLISRALIFPYLGNTRVYHCPADKSRGPSVTSKSLALRSYAMNGWVGSRYMEVIAGPTGFRTFVRDSELAAAGAPAGIWTMMDEEQSTLDDGWFQVTMNDSQVFASFPAPRHGRGAGVNFADGHVSIFTLRDPSSQPGGATNLLNPDWIRLKQMTTAP